MELMPGYYVLLLNDMRDPHVEDLKPVVCAETAEEIIAFINGERADSAWTDQGERYQPADPDWGVDGGVRPHGWRKVFKRGSPLEWCNCHAWTLEEFENSFSDRLVQYEPAPHPVVPSIQELRQ